MSDGFCAAFRTLYPRAVDAAFRVLSDRSAAEDVAAEALTRACARWDRLETTPYLDGWVLRVTTNLAIDALRRRREAPVQRVPDSVEDATLNRLAVSAALGNLPARQRQVLVLRYLADFSEEQTAGSLGIDRSSVRCHSKRALARLRRSMAIA